MRQAPLRNLPGIIIATLCLLWLPTQALAVKQGKTAKPPKAVKVPKAGKSFRDCASCPELVVIPAGSFEMGSPDSEDGRNDDEGPLHRVKVASFAIGKTEITRGQFAAFVTATRYTSGTECGMLKDGKYELLSGNWHELGYVQDDTHPVACISWNDANAYVEWMSLKTEKHYRLPTEAEWEYAARANTGSARYWSESPDEACKYANVADQTALEQIHSSISWKVHNCTDGFAYTAPAGTFKANAFGLNDMLGNVLEWTLDSYHENYNGAPADGNAWQGAEAKRVIRGGSWYDSPRYVRAAERDKTMPTSRYANFGFRVVRTIP